MQSQQQKPIDLSPPKYITATLRFLEWIYPPLAVKMAKRFFYTPIQFPRPDREKKSAEQAQRQALMVGKKRIMVYSWGKGDKKVLLVHGWAGRATQFFKIKNYLLSRGLQVVAFDAPAHGENNDVKQTHMLEFVESIERVNMTYGPFYGAIGHSLGGLAIINAYNKGFKVEKLAVIAAPCSIANVIRDFTHRIGAGERTEKGLIAHLIANYKVPLEHYSGQEQAPSVSAKGLIVHDIHDHDVSVEESRMLHKAWKGSQLFVTKRLGHRRILMDKAAVIKVADFFGKRKPGRPAKKTNTRTQKRSNASSKEKQHTSDAPRQSAPKPRSGSSKQSDANTARKRPSRKPAPKQAEAKKPDNQSTSKQAPSAGVNEKKQAPKKPASTSKRKPASGTVEETSKPTRRKTSTNKSTKASSDAQGNKSKPQKPASKSPRNSSQKNEVTSKPQRAKRNDDKPSTTKKEEK